MYLWAGRSGPLAKRTMGLIPKPTTYEGHEATEDTARAKLTCERCRRDIPIRTRLVTAWDAEGEHYFHKWCAVVRGIAWRPPPSLMWHCVNKKTWECVDWHGNKFELLFTSTLGWGVVKNELIVFHFAVTREEAFSVAEREAYEQKYGNVSDPGFAEQAFRTLHRVRRKYGLA